MQVSDKLWNKIKNELPGTPQGWGRTGTDNKKFFESLLKISKENLQWKDAPLITTTIKNTNLRARRWFKKGIFEKLTDLLDPKDPEEKKVQDLLKRLPQKMLRRSQCFGQKVQSIQGLLEQFEAKTR
jgi:transposase